MNSTRFTSFRRIVRALTPRRRLRCVPLLLAFASCVASAQSPEFEIPVEGVQGRDYFVVNYVDRDPAEGVATDYRCGSKSYDGHEGTDFVLRSFAQMDSGMWIRSAADGIVFSVEDTLFDRNKVSVVERGFGNWIGVAHENGWFTYYAHLRTGSAVVRPGDTVEAGDRIGLSGNTGHTTMPHLHFAVYRAGAWGRTQSLPVRFAHRDGISERPRRGQQLVAE